MDEGVPDGLLESNDADAAEANAPVRHPGLHFSTPAAIERLLNGGMPDSDDEEKRMAKEMIG